MRWYFMTALNEWELGAGVYWVTEHVVKTCDYVCMYSSAW